MSETGDTVVVVEAAEEPTAPDTTVVVTDSNDAVEAVEIAATIDHAERITRLEDAMTVMASQLNDVANRAAMADATADLAIEVAVEAAEEAIEPTEVATESDTDTESEAPVEDEAPKSKRHRYWRNRGE